MKQSYGEILKSSALIGGSSVLVIAIGIVRAKAMALLLGPAGVGLTGLYGSIADLTTSVAGMGISSSGVRQIAEAAASDDTGRIALTISVLRRISIALGLLGAVLLLLYSGQVSTVTFGSGRHAASICLLSLAVFFRLVSSGQSALIQGLRRIRDLAAMGILGAFFGTAISILLVYLFRENGIVPSLLAVAGTTLVTSWWYSRTVRVRMVSVTARQAGYEVAGLLNLGFAFMSSGLMTIGAAYVVRVTIRQVIGFEATGLYQSAWTLGGLYVGFILQAMGADFYPRLTARAKDNTECNRLVNEQARVGLLLAGPGAIATLTFAPAVIAIFYSAKFGAAVGVLRWICLGAALRVISWPLGYVVLAKGRQYIYFCSELAWTIAHLGLAWLLVRSLGLDGAGMAFFGSYVFQGILVYCVVRRLSNFRWSAENLKVGLFFFCLITIVFCGFYVLPFALAVCSGALAVLLSSAYSIQALIHLAPSEYIPNLVRRLIARFVDSRSGLARLD